jgi:hypothetical protein
VIAVGSGTAPITRDGARDAARRELSKAIYHRDDPPWPLRALNAIRHAIAHLLHTLARHSPGGGWGALVLLGAVAVLVAVAWWRVGSVRTDVHVTAPVLDDHRRSAADHLRAAETAAAAGRWHDAVVARMRALAQQLEDDGVLDPRPGRTADELATEVGAGRPDCAGVVRLAARTFDDVAYGGRTADKAMYDAIVAAADALRTARRGLVAGTRR